LLKLTPIAGRGTTTPSRATVLPGYWGSQDNSAPHPYSGMRFFLSTLAIRPGQWTAHAPRCGRSATTTWNGSLHSLHSDSLHSTLGRTSAMHWC